MAGALLYEVPDSLIHQNINLEAENDISGSSQRDRVSSGGPSLRAFATSGKELADHRKAFLFLWQCVQSCSEQRSSSTDAPC